MRLIGTLVVVWVAGCGGGGDAVQQCDDLVDDICDRQVDCIPSAGSHETCVGTVDQTIPCGKAVGVSDTYDRCINEILTNTCPALFPNNMLALPADCSKVINIPSSRTAPPPELEQVSRLAAVE